MWKLLLVLLLVLFAVLPMPEAKAIEIASGNSKSGVTTHKKMTEATKNRLSEETSPYLLQHATNPVDWYPWGNKALEKAKKENKPIFLSVGYSACHWCHVMEHESFEDKEVAELLNRYFVSIKVDREERPDIDDIYMTAVQTMTGHGGWPMSVFMTPEGEPFYAGTYFPKQDQHGRPGFMTIVRQLGDYWLKNEKEVRTRGKELVSFLKQQLEQGTESVELPTEILKFAITELEADFDHREGGFGAEPKFPSSMALDLCIEFIFAHDGDVMSKAIREHLRLSLRKMAQGGMYDQVGGGFHRYSTDGKWLVPHFEKMLYDNALLAKTYFEASQILDTEFNQRIGAEICDYVLLEMKHDQGAFYSTTDADSEGLEGKFFLWDVNEVKTVLGDKEGAVFCEIFGIDSQPLGEVDFPGGTPPHHWFEGRIPHLNHPLEEEMKKHGIGIKDIYAWRKKLYQQREKRVHPGRDEKVLASWNGMMSSTLITAYRIMGDEKYLQAAKENLDFIWREMQKEGRLRATWKDGDARHMGTLEDYANVIAALLELHRIVGGSEILSKARVLSDAVIKYFKDEKGKAFFYTADDADPLIVRSKNPYDNAVPAGNSVMAGNLLRLSLLLSDANYRQWAEGIFKEYSMAIKKTPRGLTRLIREMVPWQYGSREVVLINARKELVCEVQKKLRPMDIFLTERDKGLELLKGKLDVVESTLYLCSSGACKSPVKGEAEIRKKLLEL